MIDFHRGGQRGAAVAVRAYGARTVLGMATLTWGFCMLFASLLATGCDSGVAPTPGDDPANPDSMDWPTTAGSHDLSYVTSWDGRTRLLRLHLPTGFDANDAIARPLLVALHGGLGTGGSFEDRTGFSAKADNSNFIVVYPTGTGMLENVAPGTGTLGTWNASTECCGQANKNGVDDLRFLLELVSKLETAYRIDLGRVFAAGFSNGGVMTWRLGCDAPQIFAAIGINASDSTALHADGTPCDLGDRTVAVINLHGDADDNMPYYGGSGTGPEQYVREPVEDSDPALYSGQTDIGYWTALNGAPFVPVETTTATGYVRTIYCGRNDVPVINYKVLGGEHNWFDQGNSSISSTDLMWDFFERATTGAACP